MNAWIEQFISDFGYVGIALLIAFENVFPPIPSELILTFGGFMTTRTSMTIIGAVMASTIGAIVGALVLYSIGRFVKQERLKKLFSGKIGKLLRVKPAHIEQATDWFVRHGVLTVFFCRFIPIVRSLISIPAGVARMSVPLFLLYTALGSAIWNTVLILLGFWAGDNWAHIVELFDRVKYYVFIVPIIVIALVVYKKKRNKKD